MAAGSSWLEEGASLQSLPSFSSPSPLCVSNLPLIRTLLVALGMHLDNLGSSHLKIFNLITSAKALSQIKVLGCGLIFGSHYQPIIIDIRRL